MTVFLAQMVFTAFLGCVTMQGLRCSLLLPMFRSLYVCLLVTKAKVSPTKNSWTDQDVICVWSHVGPRNCVSGGGLVPPGEGAISGGHLLAVARYREYLACGQYSRPYFWVAWAMQPFLSELQLHVIIWQFVCHFCRPFPRDLWFC